MVKPKVNREKELDVFRRMLDRRFEARIMVIYADSGWGKTVLLDMIEGVCQESGVLCTRVDFRDNPLDYRGIVDCVLNELVTSAEMMGAEREIVGLIHQTPIFVGGDYAERDVVKGEHVVVVNVTPPASDLEREEQERIITGEFLTCLKRLVARGRVVCLFDTLEHAAEDVTQWLKGRLLTAVKNDRKLDGLFVVVVGNEEEARKKEKVLPRFEGWGDVIYFQAGLDPLLDEHCVQIAQKMGLDEPKEMICRYRVLLGGKPALVVAGFVNLMAGR